MPWNPIRVSVYGYNPEGEAWVWNHLLELDVLQDRDFTPIIAWGVNSVLDNTRTVGRIPPPTVEAPDERTNP